MYVKQRKEPMLICCRYGALSPAVRKQQATLFNDTKSGYDILIASDAIGMGLNLNIRRVIFSTTSKFDGKDFRELTPLVANTQGTCHRHLGIQTDSWSGWKIWVCVF